MFAVLGSGFGLYGYLPALVDGCAQTVVLPERYRTSFEQRRELSRFSKSVRWEESEQAALERAHGIVIAKRPSDQSEWIPRCLARPNLERLVLEKPLASSPEAAAATLALLIRSRRMFRIAYTFRYTWWGQRLLHAFSPAPTSGSLFIRWDFLSHHSRHGLNTWKRFVSMGGGVIRFYGIHIIALLAELGYRDVRRSEAFGRAEDELDRWTAVFEGAGIPDCEVAVDSTSAVGTFQVGLSSDPSLHPDTRSFAALIDPFDRDSGSSDPDGIDRRVPVLSRLCLSLWDDRSSEPSVHEIYEAAGSLWRRTEEVTRFRGR